MYVFIVNLFLSVHDHVQLYMYISILDFISCKYNIHIYINILYVKTSSQ